MYVSDVKNVVPLLRGSYMRIYQRKEAATSILLNLANITVRYSGISTTLVASLKAENNTRVGTLIVATIYLQLIQNRYVFRSFTVLQCSHQHCVQPVASDVQVIGYL